MRKLIAMLLALVMVLALGCAAAEEAEAPGMKTGGWAAAKDPQITEDLQAIFDKGLEKLLGVHYTPVALLGTQVVAGANYAFLCQATVVAPNADPEWKIVFLYRDLQGDVSILNIADWDFGALCTYGAPAE